jgi:NAD(P)-dependent dehydrogenase (short-subunit alcohol dehydrogenase family)
MDARAATADLDRVQRTLDTNLMGAWRTAQALLPLLRRGPHPLRGDVTCPGSWRSRSLQQKQNA